jgi:hypothetical protein
MFPANSDLLQEEEVSPMDRPQLEREEQERKEIK